MRPFAREKEEREERQWGALALVRPRYIAALRAQTGGEVAPDANGTLRITFGTVKGYRPRPDAEVYKPFTVLSEVIGKSTGERPFDAPETLLAAAKKDPGPYRDKELGEVPVDFLSDCDITGGNSGSATLNARGELVGLAFDSTYESMAVDWLYKPELNRAIHVDLRYLAWVMDAVDGADQLLVEMGLRPSLP